MPPPPPQLFLDEPPQKKTKKINSPSRFYLFLKIFFMIPLPDVIVINMKTKFSIPILQSTLFGWKKKNKKRNKKKPRANQKKEKSNPFFLGHRSLIKVLLIFLVTPPPLTFSLIFLGSPTLLESHFSHAPHSPENPTSPTPHLIKN